MSSNQLSRLKPALLLFAILSSAVSEAQTTFQKVYSAYSTDRGYSVQQTTDGGYIIGGSTNNPVEGEVLYLIKTNATGDTLWTKAIAGGQDYCNSVRQTSDGGYILAGYTYWYGAGSRDGFLVKTDASGNELWAKTDGEMYNEYFNSVRQTSGGGYILAGISDGLGAGFKDMYVVKTDVNGDTLWTRTFGGSDGDDGAQFAEETKDGGYIIGGYTGSFGLNETNDFYLVRTDANGDTLWTKTYGGSYIEAALTADKLLTADIFLRAVQRVSALIRTKAIY